MFRAVGGITAHGALSEEEGMALLRSLPRVNLVLIGGRYDEAQRTRIRAWVREMLPETPITEPGHTYAYDNDAITAEVTRLLRLPTTSSSSLTQPTTKARAAF